MPRLVVNPDTPEVWEIELRPGTNSFGRGADNDFPIEHPSISSSHCQITVKGAQAFLKDLGSTNGTFVEGELVEEAALRTGQNLALGSVTMRFESEAPVDSPPSGTVRNQAQPAEEAIPRAPRLAPPAAGFCKFHPRSAARFTCPKCRHDFCELCVNARYGHASAKRFCRACGTECKPLKPARAAATPHPRGFAGRLGGAFGYPFKGDGAMLLVAGTVCYTIVGSFGFMGGSYASVAQLGVVFLGALSTGYLMAYLRRITVSSAMGEERMPDWPDFTEFWSDAMLPLLQFLGTLVASFLPALAVAMFVNRQAAWAGAAILGGCAFGCLYFPMAFLAVAMFDSIAAVNPLLVLTSIARIPVAYLVATALFGATLAVKWAGELLLPRVLPLPILPGVLSNFIGLYLLTVEMRVLGLLYWTHKGRLNWFGHNSA